MAASVENALLRYAFLRVGRIEGGWQVTGWAPCARDSRGSRTVMPFAALLLAREAIS